MNAAHKRALLQAMPVAAALVRARRERYGNERQEALSDVRTFARHAFIQDKEGDEVAFKDVGWGWQFALLTLWAMTKLSVTLKARQLGVSWLVAIYALWVALRKPGQTVLLISYNEKEAKKLLAKVVYVYDRLPVWKPAVEPTTLSLTFPSLASVIEAMPATAKAGRSRTPNLVVLDEHAHQDYAEDILLAVKPAAAQIVSISTGNGLGALHSQLFIASKGGQDLAPTQLPDGTPLPLRVTRDVGPNGWRGVFIPYSAHPDHDAAWRVRERAESEQLSDAKFEQENPADDVEAIQATGRPVFRTEDLRRQPIEAGTPGEPGLVVYRRPVKGAVYIIGADVAEGLERSDWSSASVIDRDSGEQVAQLRGRWAPDVYAARIDRLARTYAAHAIPRHAAPVIVAVERNNHGHAVLLRLGQLAVPGCGYVLYRARDRRLGWVTSPSSRPVLVDQLEEALRTAAITLHDAGTVSQLKTFSWGDDGKPEAQAGYFDDDVLAMGVAWQVRRRSFGRVLSLPGRKAAAA